MKVAVIGAGYVGLVHAYDLAERGHEVLVIDTDKDKINKLKQNIIPFFEPDLSFDFMMTVSFTDTFDKLNGFEPSMIFVAVGTPTDIIDNSADMSYLKSAMVSVGRYLHARDTFGYFPVLIKSTVPIGTAAAMRTHMIANGVAPAAFTIVSNPEFLREGSAVADARVPERIVFGFENLAMQDDVAVLLNELYISETDKFIFTDNFSAELGKYAANAFLALKVTFINQLADLCEKANGSVSAIAKIIGTDSRIGPKFLNAGPGFGGSCFPKDVLSLIRTARNFESPMTIVETLQMANEERKIGLANRIIKEAKISLKTRLLVHGVAFKENTDDMRGAASLQIIPLLVRSGAKVSIYEKNAEQAVRIFKNVDFVDTDVPIENYFDENDVLVILNEPVNYKIDLFKAPNRIDKFTVFDYRNSLIAGGGVPSHVKYQAIGEPNSARK